MWVTSIFYATLVLELNLKMLAGSLEEDLGEDLGSLATILIFPPTLLGLFSVYVWTSILCWHTYSGTPSVVIILHALILHSISLFSKVVKVL